MKSQWISSTFPTKKSIIFYNNQQANIGDIYMPRIKTSELVPGMITAEDVYNYNNQLILPRGLELTDKSTTKMEV